MSNFCTNCGARSEGSAFCTACGHRMAQPAPTPAPTPAPAPTQTPGLEDEARGAGRHKILIVGLCLALAVALGGGGAAIWLLLKGDGSSDVTTAQSTSGDGDAGDPSPSSPQATSTSSPAATVPATSTDRDPLGLGRTMRNQACNGRYVVVLASSGAASQWRSTLLPVLTDPASHYLVTDRSCDSFVQSVGRNRIYAAYVGPWDDMASACVGLREAGVVGAYVRRLALNVASRSVCSCQPGAESPRLSRAADETIASPARGFAVSDVQVLLARAGVNDQNAFGGAFGELTQGWVRELQRRSGLPRTGVVDARTWSVLRSWCGSQDL